MHPRRVIREAVVAAIKEANTVAEDRVWDAYEPPVNVERVLMDEGPVIMVYTRRDTSSPDKDYPPSGSGFAKRRVELCIEILAAGATVVDGVLDDAAEQVEPLIDGLAVPGLPATEIRHSETNLISSDQFEQPVGGAFIMYDADYWKQWRQDLDEDVEPWFPRVVSSEARGDAPAVVATCDECDECPDGAPE